MILHRFQKATTMVAPTTFLGSGKANKSQFDSALMMGLMFHGKAKRLVKNRKYEDVVKVPAMGEEAFLVCDPKVVEKDSFMEISFHIPNDNTQFVGDENRPLAQVSDSVGFGRNWKSIPFQSWFIGYNNRNVAIVV
ncbi:hypothetical protein L1887_17932 [Cichorium endivia]|nr:hypothetical protein L1887_17932 [Cichorium endivia]